MTHVWRRADSSVCRIAMKGSVEGVLEHCRVTPEERAQIDDLVKQYASQGRRLLGLAMREGAGTGVRAADEQDLEFLAVLVFSDPIRPSVAQAIAACQAAGIEIKMVTGDHPFTARHVADEAGIRRAPDTLFTGQELERMDAGQRRRAFLEGSLFSRVVPEQKLEMVRSLQESGRVVAMIGDGINDALALRLADIGISMGRSATDVARSAAQIVLMESDFSGIVATLMEGRRILSNLKRSFAYLVSFHVPVILLTLLPPFLGWPPLLMPLHIIALELVVHPVSALVFENLPMEAPRAATKGESSAGLIGRSSLVASLAAGVLVSLGALTSYGLLTRSATVEVARSSAFAAVLAGNVAFAAAGVLPRLTLRFGVTSALLLGSVILIAIVPLAPLHLSPMSWGVTLGALGIGALGVLPGLVVSRRRA
ncbi:MAG: HAD-IC family P-type ATPase [Deltaproteobacteria bacterium]|nr:HAD-IC family P-type ATPase [Deltaproteobacteria bacterium]